MNLDPYFYEIKPHPLGSTQLKVESWGHGIIHLQLNRPEVHNAFNDEVIATFSQCLTELAATRNWSDLRILVISGEGKSFCAGADLTYMQRTSDQSEAQNLNDARKLGQMFYKLASFPVPVVTVAKGAVMGGGMGIACCSDFLLAHENTSFALSEVLLGIIPAVISPYVIRKFGSSVASRLMLSGQKVNAKDLQDWGLLHGVFASEDQKNEDLNMLLKQLLKCGPNAQRRTKELIKKCSPLPNTDIFEFTATSIALARASEEGAHGIKTFLEKKIPNWIPQNLVPKSQKESP